ncbi:MAG: NADase-type glycan-binding domain-containing protein [Acidobacteriota bacterium]
MPALLLFFMLFSACPAWAQKTQVSLPLSFQIDASGSPESGENLARLVSQTNTAGVALGEWIEFDFGRPVVITGVNVVNGWAEAGAYRQYGRIKNAVLNFKDGTTHSITLRDTDKPQTLPFSGKGQTLRLAVASVYPGGVSTVPYLTRISFMGYDPGVQQVTLTGRFEGCVRSGSSSDVEGGTDPFYYCARFRADDGSIFGCLDDLCFHPRNMVSTHLSVTGLVKPGNVLEVIEASPVGQESKASGQHTGKGKPRKR